jgi:EAL domain-containing protein (putative c-di-GMP-specific phosphodiesterase class I)
MRAAAGSLRQRLLDRPGGTVLVLGVIVALTSSELELVNFHNSWLLFEDIALPLAPTAGALALAVAAIRGERQYTPFRSLAAALLALSAAGQLMRDLPGIYPALAGTELDEVSDALNVVGAVTGICGVAWTMARQMNAQARSAVFLDGLIMLFAGTAVAIANWLPSTGQPTMHEDPAASLIVPAISAVFLASTGATLLAGLALRIRPGVEGVWAVAGGMVLIWLAWAGWIGRFLLGAPDTIEPMDVIYPIGAILIAYGGITWNLRQGGGLLYDRIADGITEWLPVAAIVGCALLGVLPRPRPLAVDPVEVTTAIVIVLAVLRQQILQGRVREVSQRLTSEITERAAATVSLARLEAGTTVETTAERICTEALQTEGIDIVTVLAFGPSGVVPIAQGGAGGGQLVLGEPLPPDRARELRQHADFGLWLESWVDRVPRDDHDRIMIASGLRAEALAPLIWNEEIIGVISMGATSAARARRLASRLPTLTEFSVMSAAVLGPLLAERWHRDTLIADFQSLIDTRDFIPVFQAIVELSTGRSVGFEALTRFADGTRPDLRFLAADKVGMMVRLEAACLNEQVEHAWHLPEGAFVTLNVSPALVLELEPLLAVLDKADRPVVLEVTEHVEINDYDRLLAVLGLVRDRVQLAVDDAGSGYAGLHHILELRPQFVKLDISLVRNIDSDPARQAMVTGMASFAASVGCDLIAEGLETAGEVAAVRRLGVKYGQGYFLSRPVTVGPTSTAYAA